MGEALKPGPWVARKQGKPGTRNIFRSLPESPSLPHPSLGKVGINICQHPRMPRDCARIRDMVISMKA